jgi:hypothetical protein
MAWLNRIFVPSLEVRLRSLPGLKQQYISLMESGSQNVKPLTVAALVAFLASTADTSEMADRPDPLIILDNPTDAEMHGSEVASAVPQRAARHSVSLRRAWIKPITDRTVQG